MEDWQQCNPHHANSYEEWKNDFINDANSEADLHTQKYNDFLSMIEAWQQQEAALGGQSATGKRGRGKR